MCGPAALVVPWVMAGVATAGTAASMIQTNQATQHAKGAAEAQQTAANAANAEAAKIGPAQTSPVVSDSAASAQAQARKRQAAMAAGMVSTIGTSGQGISGTPASLQPQAYATGMKTALGQ